MASFFSLKTRCNAIVNSTTPKLLARCPPFLPTTSIIFFRISDARIGNLSLEIFFKSSGFFMLERIVKSLRFSKKKIKKKTAKVNTLQSLWHILILQV